MTDVNVCWSVGLQYLPQRPPEISQRARALLVTTSTPHHEAAAVESSQHSARFLELPFEILTQVLGLVLPHRQLLAIHTCDHHKRPASMAAILSILLIHPTVYRVALQQLYSENQFHFCKLQSLRDFTDTISDAARASIRKAHVNACCRRHRQQAAVAQTDIQPINFKQAREKNITDILAMYPSLIEITLGGIMHNSIEMDKDDLLVGSLDSVQSASQEYWRGTDCITLIARLDGACTGIDKSSSSTIERSSIGRILYSYGPPRQFVPIELTEPERWIAVRLRKDDGCIRAGRHGHELMLSDVPARPIKVDEHLKILEGRSETKAQSGKLGAMSQWYGAAKYN